jgi:hypothetical protein
MENFQGKYRSFEGAVIDLESDGEPFQDYLYGAHRYAKHSATSFGILDKDHVEVITKTYETTDEQFVQEVEKALHEINRPYYAFNAEFDMALLSKLLDKEIAFERDVMVIYAKKELLVGKYGISNFDDPFKGEGNLAGISWKKHLQTRDMKYVLHIVAHNRACVLKEYSLLLYHGYKSIEPNSCRAFFDGKRGLCISNICEKL